MMKGIGFVLVAFITSSSLANAKDVKVTVNGMVCAFCAQGIQKKLSAQEAVKAVDVNLDNHLVKIDLKEGKSLSDQTIRQILSDAGYTVTNIERD